MKRLVLPLLLLLSCALSVWGYDEDKLKGYELNLSGGLYITPSTTPAWSLEPEVLWRFHKYIGASLGMEITRQYGTSSRSTTIDGHLANLSKNEEAVGWLIFKPGLVLCSPNIWSNSKEEKSLWLEATVGASLACPFRNSLTYEIVSMDGMVSEVIGYKTFPNNGLRWFYLNSKIQAKFSVDRLIFGAGYSLSSFDYYSCRRNVTLEGGQKFQVPKKQFSQTIFVSVGYRF